MAPDEWEIRVNDRWGSELEWEHYRLGALVQAERGTYDGDGNPVRVEFDYDGDGVVAGGADWIAAYVSSGGLVRTGTLDAEADGEVDDTLAFTYDAADRLTLWTSTCTTTTSARWSGRRPG